ncbi:MAG TPA: hypothetical protein VJL82_05315 [Rhizomicrobium sp.]|nr:hypothetical protein [Rhizomicrobium sp.]
MAWLGTLPLTIVALTVLAALLVAATVGYRGHLWLLKRSGETYSESHDYLLSAVLGLLALLLGFTFSLALNRYEDRRDLVVQEANAIGTAWLRTQILEPPNKAAISQLLRAYLDARLAWSEADAGATARTMALQQSLWAATGQAVRTEPNPLLPRALMDPMNQSFELASARNAAGAAHVPDRVLTVLLLYAVLAAAMLGYTAAAKGKPQRIATVCVLVAMTLALVMILDIDRPRSGAIQVSQQPLEELKQSWR